MRSRPHSPRASRSDRRRSPLPAARRNGSVSEIESLLRRRVRKPAGPPPPALLRTDQRVRTARHKQLAALHTPPRLVHHPARKVVRGSFQWVSLTPASRRHPRACAAPRRTPVEHPPIRRKQARPRALAQESVTTDRTAAGLNYWAALRKAGSSVPLEPPPSSAVRSSGSQWSPGITCA
jgi:hypothetical protein